jgi:hypothetical protein
MKTNRENRGLFLFTLIDDLFAGKGEHADENHLVSNRLFYGLLVSATLVAILLGVVRRGWMSE